jgi:hypothetical protein
MGDAEWFGAGREVTLLIRNPSFRSNEFWANSL